MQDKVLDLVQRKGPVLPVEIASELNIDSFLAGAYLAELAAAGRIQASKQRVGSTALYYVSGQEAAVTKRLADLSAQKPKISTYQRATPAATPEIARKREAFATRLQEIEKREKEGPAQRPEKVLFPKISRAPLFEKLKRTVTPIIKRNFGDQVVLYFEEKGIEIVSRDSKRGRKDFVIAVPSAMGPVHFFVRASDKQKIGKSDLSLAHSEGQERKLPVIFIMSGQLTKPAIEYLKKVGDLLKIKKLEL